MIVSIQFDASNHIYGNSSIVFPFLFLLPFMSSYFFLFVLLWYAGDARAPIAKGKEVDMGAQVKESTSEQPHYPYQASTHPSH